MVMELEQVKLVRGLKENKVPVRWENAFNLLAHEADFKIAQLLGIIEGLGWQVVYADGEVDLKAKDES